MEALPVEMNMPNGLRVIVGDLGSLPADFAERLDRQGFDVRGVVEHARVVETVRAQSDCDAVLLFAPRVDETALNVVKQLASDPARPMAMFCEEADRNAIQRAVSAGVNAYVVTGVTASRVQAAVNLALANHNCTVGLKEELDEAKQALRERRIIERAKGIIMSQRGMDEADAYKLIRTRAMQRGMRLVDVARALTDAEDLIG